MRLSVGIIILLGENRKCYNRVTLKEGVLPGAGIAVGAIFQGYSIAPPLLALGCHLMGQVIGQKSHDQFLRAALTIYLGLKTFEPPKFSWYYHPIAWCFPTFAPVYPPRCPCRAATDPPHHVALSARSLRRKRRDSPGPSLPEDLLIDGPARFPMGWWMNGSQSFDP